MRQAGSLPNEADAQRFVDYLFTLGIEAKADVGPGTAAVWILDENRLVEGKAELEAYRQNPTDAKYITAARQASALRKQTADKQRRAARNFIDMSQRWASPGVRGRRPLTWFLIAVCVAVALVTDFGKNQAPIDPYLFMTAVQRRAPSEEEIERRYQETEGDDPEAKMQAVIESFQPYNRSLTEIRHGQLWRLVTPIFIHMTIMHLAFNMLWLFFMGGMIEDRYGSLWFGFLVLLSAVISNLLQVYWKGPIFGGMSGVNYALIGYVWMKGKFEPTSGLYIGQRDVMLALLWFALCFTGQLGPVANGAHAGGLIVGVVLGYLPTLLRRWS